MKKRTLRSALVLLSAAFAVAGGTGVLAADAFPSKQIKLVVGFAPGGSHDIVARLLAQHLAPRLGQTVIVDNRVGAAGTIGANYVIRSPADGHTLLVGSVSNMVITPVSMEQTPFDPRKDFEPVVAPTTTPLLLVTKADSDLNSVQGVLKQSKAKPGSLTFASAGMGASNHLAGELLGKMAGVQLTHVPYKGDAPGVMSVMSGETNIMFSTLPPALPHIQSGRLKVLAVAGAERLAGFPDAPTVAESGVPGFEVNIWNGVVAPAGTPAEVVNKLNQEIRAIVNLPEVAERLQNMGFERISNSPAAFKAMIQSDSDKWRSLAESLGMVGK